MAAELLNNKRDIKETSHTFYKHLMKKHNFKWNLEDDAPQEQRRQVLLEFQRKFRDEAFNAARGILQQTFFSELDDEETMQVEKCPSKPKARSKYHGHQVMMSEWLLDIPQDFSDKYIMVPCPQGKRCILVAGRGITKAYTRKGRICATFSSALPGGNPTTNRHHFAIIDCIWIKSQKVYYVLDVLAWRNQPITNCEAEFRLYWIDTNIQEIKDLRNRNTDTNGYPILLLPHINCNSDLSSAFANFGNLPPLDGLLFYHRNGQYTFGYTPLVMWLKPFMLPEIFGMFVPAPFDEKPDGYIDFKHYICKNSKNKKNIILQDSMEVVEDNS